ncbi:MAG: hypothetical protein OSA98_16950 [Rubripirellula sp.]|nr:hypothetical protein [Rubripirellula sp.]
MNKFVATQPAIGMVEITILTLGQPIQDEAFVYGSRLLSVHRWHFRRDQFLEHQRAVKVIRFQQANKIEPSLFRRPVMAIKAVGCHQVVCIRTQTRVRCVLFRLLCLRRERGQRCDADRGGEKDFLFINAFLSSAIRSQSTAPVRGAGRLSL